MDEKSKKGSYIVPAIDKSIAILNFLSLSGEGQTMSTIGKELNIAKTSVFSILHTLETHNFVRKDPDGLYTLGLKLYSLGILSVRNIDSKAIFVPHMEVLRAETEFTVHMVAYDNGETVCLEKLEGPGSIRFLSYVGERKRLNTSACGKAIAAYLTEKELQIMFSKGLNHLTPNSISTEPALREHLHEVRQSGYAIDDEEGEIGIRCIGAPIFMNDGIVYGGISVSTLKTNLPFQRIPHYAEKVLTAAKKISNELGYTGDAYS
ncbi:IclR family transcriptional regulator [Paenibacillus mendelii]|uniref:IclR family transcriptional regulator n=1 Tax=Paenibacillus mendelii TaxID=206163 RepID=A0ABV6JFF5_9BACL|nr:IclR family transcriptional regulator [Paenibacillus mendelii]MCQ6557477.1 IclR family transcriptional regulator [Paenibacillus mendelii]